MKQFIEGTIYFLFLVAFAAWLWPVNFSPLSRKYIFVIGLITVWRYGWFLINALRASFYKLVYYPIIKKKP